MSFSLDPVLEKDAYPVGDFRLCRLLLMNDSNYPWFILVPRREGLRELYELTREDQVSYLLESNYLSQMLVDIFKAEKLNIAALGNQVSQLHLHHIARFKADPSWPKPVWGQVPAKPYEANELIRIVESVRAFFSTKLKDIIVNSH